MGAALGTIRDSHGFLGGSCAGTSTMAGLGAALGTIYLSRRVRTMGVPLWQ